jgi:tetratricopeptide (TPR) repeat protein
MPEAEGEAMTKRWIIIAIAFLLLIPAAVFSQIRGQAKMLGVVLDEESGQPVEGVTVKPYFRDTDTYFTPFPKTDKQGKWKVLFIRTGMWSIELDKVGYIPQKVSHRVIYEEGMKVPEFEVRLKPIKGLVVKSDVVSELEKGDRLYSEKKFEEALAAFQSALQKSPDLYIIKMNIGNCYFGLQNYEKALENYLQVYEKQPDRGDVLVAIANTYVNSGKQDQAIEWYKKVPLSGIQDINTAYNTGVVFLDSGDQADALKYFQKAVEIDPQFADGYYQLGLCHVALGSTAEAVEALKKSVELAPDSANAATAKAIIETLSKK